MAVGTSLGKAKVKSISISTKNLATLKPPKAFNI
jgi:hypothetical protein